MKYLEVDGHDLPTTYDGWVSLDGDDLAAIGEVFTDKLFIDISDSVLYKVCPAAFNVTFTGDTPCAPLHEVESLLSRFARPACTALELVFCQSALTPVTFGRIEALLTAKSALFGGFDDVGDEHDLVRRLIKARAVIPRNELIAVSKNDFVALEECSDRTMAQGGWIDKITIEALCQLTHDLSIVGDLSALLGPRAHDQTRTSNSKQFKWMANFARQCAQSDDEGNDNAEYAVAGDMLVEWLHRTTWPETLVVRVDSRISALTDLRSRKNFALATTDKMASALQPRLVAVVGAYKNIAKALLPCAVMALASHIRRLLSELDNCGSYTLIVPEALAALDSELGRLNQSFTEDEPISDRVSRLVGRKMQRDDMRQAASSGAAADAASGSSSASSSSGQSCFQRGNVRNLESLVSTHPKFANPLVRAKKRKLVVMPGEDEWEDDPAGEIDEVSSGLNAMAAHANYEQPVELLRVAFNKRILAVYQFCFSNQQPPPNMPVFAALARARGFLGEYFSNMSVVDDFGSNNATDFSWRIAQTMTPKKDSVADVPKSFLDAVKNGNFHTINFYNDFFISFEEHKRGELAPPRMSGGIIDQWTERMATESIKYAERLFASIGFPRGAPNGFGAFAVEVNAFHLKAPRQAPMAHAAAARSIILFALADFGSSFKAFLDGPPNGVFPDFYNTSRRARSKLIEDQGSMRRFDEQTRLYPQLAKVLGGGSSADGATAATKPPKDNTKKDTKPPPKDTKPPPKDTRKTRPPGSMADKVTELPGALKIHWDATADGSKAARDAKYDTNGMGNACGCSKTCWPFQIVFALTTRDGMSEEAKRKNALAWCKHFGKDANHKDYDSPYHKPIAGLDHNVVRNFLTET